MSSSDGYNADTSLDDLFRDSFTSTASTAGQAGVGEGGAADFSFESELMAMGTAGASHHGSHSNGVSHGIFHHANGGGGGGDHSSSSSSYDGGFTSLHQQQQQSSASLNGSIYSNASSPEQYNNMYGGSSGSSYDSLSPPFAMSSASSGGPTTTTADYSQQVSYAYGTTGMTSYAPTQQQQQVLQPSSSYMQQPSPPSARAQPGAPFYTPQSTYEPMSSVSPPSSAYLQQNTGNGMFQLVYPGANSNATMSLVEQQQQSQQRTAALSRMLADAQAQQQMTPQMGYDSSSFLAGVQAGAADPRQAFALSQQQNTTMQLQPQVAFAPSIAAAPPPSKKRKASAAPANSQRRGSAQHSQQQQHIYQPQPVSAAAAAQGYHFVLNESMLLGANNGGMSAGPQSVALIANAGLAPGSYHTDTTNTMNGVDPSALDTERPASPGGKGKKASDKPLSKKAAAAAEKKKKGQKGHNDVERRYRNNINNHLAALRDAIPALRHLKPLPSMPPSRRRASQFTLSSAATAPTPEGLVDGVPAAKTLSKGSILGKSIEYITYLQSARRDAQEDIELFKSVVLELVAGGQTLVDVFEERRAAVEVQRAVTREKERIEQERLDAEEDGVSGDEDEEEDIQKPAPVAVQAPQVKATKVKGKAATQAQSASAPKKDSSSSSSSEPSPAHYGLSISGTGLSPPQPSSYLGHSPRAFPPSPVSSSEEAHISPRLLQQYRGHASQPPRVLLASFMGLSFAGGLGYDWTYNNMAAESGGDAANARAWATRLVKRGASSAASASPSAPLIASNVVGPAILNGFVALGIVSLLAIVVFILRPSLFVSADSSKPFTARAPQGETGERSRSAYRQRRRAQALGALAHLNKAVASAPTYASERDAALKARKELLKLVGAPTYALLPALCKEALATLLRKVTTIRVGSFASWSREDRIEAAVAWVRIAEIEATVGAHDVNYLARCYTFLRLFNLSHSPQWPQTTPSTVLASVNAVLSMHLLSLGQPLSAQVLWHKATRGTDHKKATTGDGSPRPALHPWTEIAIATDFATVRAIFASSTPSSSSPSCPSDTMPLLRISEARCAAALREAWAKIFVGVVQTTCPPHAPQSPMKRFSDLVDLPFLEETVRHVLESTIEGAKVHALAKMTKSLCATYAGRTVEGAALAKEVELEWGRGGPASRLQCAEAFRQLAAERSALPRIKLNDGLLADPADDENAASDVDPETDMTQVDLVATATLGWLLLRRQALLLPSPSLSSGIALKADPQLHADTLAIRRLLGHDVFRDGALRKFCAVKPLSGTAPPEASDDDLDLDGALDSCMDALVGITRRAAGLRSEDDSGVECD